MFHRSMGSRVSTRGVPDPPGNECSPWMVAQDTKDRKHICYQAIQYRHHPVSASRSPSLRADPYVIPNPLPKYAP